MKWNQVNRLATAVLLLGPCTASVAPAQEPIKHIVVIGIDGLSASGLRGAETPVMDSLIAAGSASWSARTVLPSVSSPNWASILLGAGPEQHGVTSNDWKLETHTLPAVVRGSDGRFPSIFSVLKSQHPDAQVGSVYQWEGFGRLYNHAFVDYDLRQSTADSTAAAAAHYIQENRPVLTVVHLDHVDGAGHHYGHGSPAYFQAISKADTLVGQLLDGIKRAGIAGETLVIITSDHGGIGKGHGGETPEETTIPLIMSGPGIKAGYQLKQPIYPYDIAATIAFALQLKRPYVWIGRPIRAAFTGADQPENEGLSD
ncbi:alkaline phosphatase [Parapedobacter lycopersici]|uniref:alkaline phosphatase n=1 Tax=Parapedobacter lycopersici TaxID=1864939 RepID=UPI00214D8929|nr:alkaline phosphatase [Parapedobacter lycopersici]